MIRLLLTGVVRLYRWLPPRSPRCSMVPGCSARVLAGLLDRTMGFADVARCGSCCPSHAPGWKK